MIELRPLSREDAEQIRVWRLDFPETLRTAQMLNADQQQDWYTREIANRESHTRYFALYDVNLVGYGGIENIQWENRCGEISVMIAKKYHGMGYGSAAVGMFLDHAFNRLNLDAVWGECYECGHVGFWERICAERGAFTARIPNRKYWDGRYYGSLFFVFGRKNGVS